MPQDRPSLSAGQDQLHILWGQHKQERGALCSEIIKNSKTVVGSKATLYMPDYVQDPVQFTRFVPREWAMMQRDICPGTGRVSAFLVHVNFLMV